MPKINGFIRVVRVLWDADETCKTDILNMSFFRRVFIFLYCGVWACQNNPNKTTIGFYYWKNIPKTGGLLSDSLIKNLNIQRLYIKFMDIDWQSEHGAYPRDKTVHDLDKLPEQCGKVEMVPVFYIVHRVFEKMPPSEYAILAERLVKMLGSRYSEIQLDCDWTANTRDAYFKWLKMLRTQLPPSTQISVTIRLHQIKYRKKMGVPPVDKGMLMVYNLLNPADFNERNSIFEPAEAAKYLQNQPTYPLPLDVALPLFRWGVTYRNHKYIHLFNYLSEADAQDLSFLTRKGRFYEVNTDTVFQTMYLRYGDKIKIEAVSEEDLLAAARLAAPLCLNNKNLHISYFHYDTNLIQSFKKESYEQVQQIFQDF